MNGKTATYYIAKPTIVCVLDSPYPSHPAPFKGKATLKRGDKWDVDLGMELAKLKALLKIKRYGLKCTESMRNRLALAISDLCDARTDFDNEISKRSLGISKTEADIFAVNCRIVPVKSKTMVG